MYLIAGQGKLQKNFIGGESAYLVGIGLQLRSGMFLMNWIRSLEKIRKNRIIARKTHERKCVNHADYCHLNARNARKTHESRTKRGWNNAKDQVCITRMQME